MLIKENTTSSCIRTEKMTENECLFIFAFREEIKLISSKLFRKFLTVLFNLCFRKQQTALLKRSSLHVGRAFSGCLFSNMKLKNLKLISELNKLLVKTEQAILEMLLHSLKRIYSKLCMWAAIQTSHGYNRKWEFHWCWAPATNWTAILIWSHFLSWFILKFCQNWEKRIKKRSSIFTIRKCVCVCAHVRTHEYIHMYNILAIYLV